MSRWWMLVAVALIPGCGAQVAEPPVNGTAVVQAVPDRPSAVPSHWVRLSPTAGAMVAQDVRRAGETLRLSAIGHDPSWQLEVHDLHIVFVTGPGASRVDLLRTGTLADPPRTTYRASADGRTVVVIAERRSCTDAMTGESFDLTVTATLDGRPYDGCGRFAIGVKLDVPDPARR